MFSKENFIVPLNLDVILKIRNTKGVVVHIIKESTCTLKVIENTILIKQSSESKLISLDFSTPAEALLAHVILRDSLTILSNNQNLNATFNGYLVYSFSPNVDTVINVDSDFNIPIMSEILSVYVNGVLINNTTITNYALLFSPNRLRWFGTAIYILETTDIITIHYV